MKRADKGDAVESSILQAEYQVLLGNERRRAAFRVLSGSASRVATTAAQSALAVVGLLALIWVLPKLLQIRGKKYSTIVVPSAPSRGAVVGLPAIVQIATSPLLRPAITSLVVNIAHKALAGWRGRSEPHGDRLSAGERHAAAAAPAPSGLADKPS